MAGGYRGHYVLTDDFGRQITFGGRSLDRVWMFDGAYWEEMAPMDTVRDRPACSLFSGAQGKIKVRRKRQESSCFSRKSFDVEVTQSNPVSNLISTATSKVFFL